MNNIQKLILCAGSDMLGISLRSDHSFYFDCEIDGYRFSGAAPSLLKLFETSYVGIEADVPIIAMMLLGDRYIPLLTDIEGDEYRIIGIYPSNGQYVMIRDADAKDISTNGRIIKSILKSYDLYPTEKGV